MRFLPFIQIFISIALLSGYANNPPNGRTGAPGESTCRDCHSSYTLNSGLGSLNIVNVPDAFEPGQIYSIQVAIAHPTFDRWGFELAVKTDDHNQAGEITVTQSTYTSTSTMGGITYLKQKSAGTFNGTEDVVFWSFDWTAPTDYDGTVHFYAAGNCSNGNSNPGGDYIYTTSTTTELVVECPLMGDFNEDDTVNILDIVQIVNSILGPGQQLECVDMNGDGFLNILDIVLIVNIIMES